MAYVDDGRESMSARSGRAWIFGFAGRADAREFRRWAPLLGFALLFALAAGLSRMVPWTGAGPIAGAAAVALVALTVRRLHDVGASGRTVWLQLALMAAMGLTGAAIHGHTVSLLVGEGLLGSMAVATVAVAVVIWRRVRRPGEAGPNRFGPPRR